MSPVTASLFAILALVEMRPGMYVGFSEFERGQQLRALDVLIGGYTLAIHQHGLQDPGFDAYAGFPDFLKGRFGWSMSCGPIAAILEASENDDEAWNSFWRLLWEYRDQSNVDVPNPSPGECPHSR